MREGLFSLVNMCGEIIAVPFTHSRSLIAGLFMGIDYDSEILRKS
jgi:hypothetical protein|tara:strand:- start:1554 stop:1688 length:135 start_codon:yes stop_codon:yes gene_type:complete